MPRKAALLLVLVLVVAAAGVGLLASAKSPAPETSSTPSTGNERATALAPSTADVDAALRELDLVKPSRLRGAEDFALPALGGGSFRLSEQRGKNGGHDGSICLNGRVGKEQNFAATQAARYELERCCGRQTRSVPLCLADIVGQREARFNEVIT